MNYTIEKTEKEILVRFPIDATNRSIQNLLEYFEFLEVATRSKATQSDINRVADDVQQQWWDKNKSRFKDIEGLEEQH